MADHEEAGAASSSDEELLETIGTAFTRLRRRTGSVPLDPPVAPTDVRRDRSARDLDTLLNSR